MARMIPAVPHPDCRSEGELDLFARLRDESGTKDWIVLHSLFLSTHRTQRAGEVDFVVIAPGHGILCVEVKGCHAVRVDERGGWFYGTTGTPDYRGPFRQASEAMFSLRDWIKREAPDLADCFFATAVVFPFCSLRHRSPEFESWQLIDASTYLQRPLSDQLKEVFRRSADKADRDESRLCTPSQADRLANLLRPSFERASTPSEKHARLHAELKTFTAEQGRYLDALRDDNPRILVRGPAGTGKTVLAIESAKLAAAGATQDGRLPRVLIACYNSLLGQHLQNELGGIRGVRAGTFHQALLAEAGLTAPQEAPHGFWSEELPQRAIQKLIDRGSAPYETLIIDEAQDLLRPAYLDAMDLLVEGGIAAGRWLMFGDFERQAIYCTDDSIEPSLDALAAAKPTRIELRDNCRNTPRIAALGEQVGRLRPGYRRVLRPDDRIDFRLELYSDNEEAERELEKALLTLKNDEGFSARDIVVLSTASDEASCAARLANRCPRLLRPIRSSKTGVAYASIHAFKGLESPAVILTDLEDFSSARATSLAYVGVTRALRRVWLLVNRRANDDALKLLTQ